MAVHGDGYIYEAHVGLYSGTPAAAKTHVLSSTKSFEAVIGGQHGISHITVIDCVSVRAVHRAPLPPTTAFCGNLRNCDRTL